MDENAKIYVAGHRGLVGSALVRRLQTMGYRNLVCRTHTELDLTDKSEVENFFAETKPEYVFLAAAKVGGILANDSYPADFIYQNLSIQNNVIHAAYLRGVKRLLFLGSSCIYPKDCPQPIKEEYLMTGPLESTNKPYALAKIAGIEMCWAYNRQYGTKFLAVMPTNIYGPDDNFDLQTSHVLPALIRKMHEAKVRCETEVVVWGTGAPRREFLFSEDLAEGCIFLMNLPVQKFDLFLQGAPVVNVGFGQDIEIKELAQVVKEVVGFDGTVAWDPSKPDGTIRKLLDVTRLKSIGWSAVTPLRVGIRDVYQQYLENYCQ